MSISKLPCSDCGSSDALTDYGDHTWCFSCATRHRKDEEELQEDKIVDEFFTIPIKEIPSTGVTPIDQSRFFEIKSRGISKATCQFYGVTINPAGEHIYPYFDKDGKRHVANQFRTTGTKGFMIQGGPEYNKSGLFGQQLFPPNSSKQITILEGALDALSCFQMTGSKYPAVAVKSASSARKDVADNFQYLNSFDQIVIAFDKDDEHKRDDGTVWFPGQEAAQKVAQMFELGKVRVLTLKKAKDANDYLKNGWGVEFQEEWWKAPVWSPAGLRLAKDMWDEVIREDDNESIPYPWEGLNKLTYGIRTSEFVTITAMPGVGKTSMLQEIVFNILQTIMTNKDDNRGVGLMMLESSNKETLLGLMSLAANKPLHLPDVRFKVPENELRKYFDAVYGTEKVVIWDHFGSNEIDKVLDFVRYMHNLGAKYIILDHLSIIVSDQNGDERKQLDEISTKLKTLCMELKIGLLCVIHQNRKGEIRGTMGVEQLSNIVIKLFRDVKSDDEEVRNTTKVTVEKNRFSGRTGPACLLSYSGETGRLTELPELSLQEYIEQTKEKMKEDKDEW